LLPGGKNTGPTRALVLPGLTYGEYGRYIGQGLVTAHQC
jgi:hypothetical protein